MFCLCEGPCERVSSLDPKEGVWKESYGRENCARQGHECEAGN